MQLLVATSFVLATLPQDPTSAAGPDPLAPGSRVLDSGTVQLIEGVFADPGGGALIIEGDDLVVDLSGSPLVGAAAGTPGDRRVGTGIVVRGQGITLRHARVSGYHIGIHADGVDGLVLEDCDVSGNFRQHLGSTAEVEDSSDWLYPHNNDQGEWRRNYGAGILIENSTGPVVRRCRAREGQNGLLLERVTDGEVYDNDFSFLSGWGVAMWRTEGTLVSRNALDFCVRGYSHGVYNRGQDSAGILMFEQCVDNVLVENSATHGGDGFFGFAGSEALGKAGVEDDGFDRLRRGNNRNLLIDNDFSYAVAHGIEMTFSFDNQFLRNRIVGNGICGVWGGYSRDTLIAFNEFTDNGDLGYGLERGGVNIEHGQGIRVISNEFRGNRCGVHLWWDEDAHLRDLPWTGVNGYEVRDNVIAGNRFVGDALGVHLRDAGATWIQGNARRGLDTWIQPEGESEILSAGDPDLGLAMPSVIALGDTRPVGARLALRGREHIVVDEWGPHDWSEPIFVRRSATAGSHLYELLGAKEGAEIVLVGGRGQHDARILEGEGPPRLEVSVSEGFGSADYRVDLRVGSWETSLEGWILAPSWEVTSFGWTVDPREDEGAWLAESVGGLAWSADELDLRFGGGGPLDLESGPGGGAPIGSDRFGTLASTEVSLPSGNYTLETVSDDGIRVWLNGELVIDDWTWHAPKRNDYPFDVKEGAAPQRIRVHHFELDGHAELRVRVVPGR